MKKAMEEPDEFTKKILDCPCVPEYIKKCPFFLMMFKAEIIRCHARQSLAAYRMKESLCCGKCCCETPCKKDNLWMYWRMIIRHPTLIKRYD
eukprot:gnl/Chilomastix_caulleri/9021.p2 GENE.gnl/Chilomastix_caulleri/9021~~gnl/Chilomastix_caulleri/9021.p2  ORF type:complete len:92 (+),score=24.35 gnl/Chilomastix_caulleri/9021:79-354(+)